MEILKREKTLQTSFFDLGTDQDNESNSTWGYLTFLQESGRYYLSFTETANPVKKTAHLAVESADMAPEAAKMAWRVGSLTVKAFMGIRPTPWEKVSMKEGMRQDQKSLDEKMARHRADNFGLDKLENHCFRVEINRNSQIIVFPGKEKINALGISGILFTGYRKLSCDQKHNRNTAYFRLSGSSSADAWADYIKNRIPGIPIQREDPRDIFHRL